MLLFLQAAAFASDIWLVDPDGSADFLTLTEALWVAKPGDEVHLGAGTYCPSGGEDFPLVVPGGVTVRGKGPESTILDGESEAEGLLVVRTSGVVLSGITLSNSVDVALVVLDESGSLLLEDCSVRDNQGADEYGAGFSGYGSIVDCSFSGNDAEGGADIAGAVSLFRVEVVASPERYRWGPNVDIEEGGDIDRCFFLGGSVRGSGQVSNSLFVGLWDQEASVSTCISARGEFTNNTVVGCEADFVILPGQLSHSILAFNEGAVFREDVNYPIANLLYANEGGDWAGEDWTGKLGNLSADPMFRDFSDDGDWTNDDFRLYEGSPAIDAATSDAPTHDLDGVPRPQDGNGDGLARPDIGCYEWGLIDQDNDGWYVEDDCDDTDPDINPGAEEIPYDGIDQDCDGADLIDVDGDGHDADHQGGDDCDDTDADVHPGAWDIPDNGIDEDCDGADTHDTDGDGWPDDQDCDPMNTNIHPGAEERCNGVDDDCDGDIDEDGVCEETDTAEGIGTCGCDCRGGDDTGAAWLVMLLPAWMWRRRRDPTAPR